MVDVRTRHNWDHGIRLFDVTMMGLVFLQKPYGFDIATKQVFIVVILISNGFEDPLFCESLDVL